MNGIVSTRSRPRPRCEILNSLISAWIQISWRRGRSHLYIAWRCGWLTLCTLSLFQWLGQCGQKFPTNQPLRARENLSPERQNTRKSQISLNLSDPNGSQLFRVYMENFFQIVLSRRCIGVGDFKIRNVQPNAFLLPAGSLCYDKHQGLERFQQTNRISDPRNEKVWHNISNGSVSIEIIIFLQHMKLTSVSESYLNKWLQILVDIALNKVFTGQNGSKSWEIDFDWSVPDTSLTLSKFCPPLILWNSIKFSQVCNYVKSEWYELFNIRSDKMLSFFPVAEALTGENSCSFLLLFSWICWKSSNSSYNLRN